ncbi:MAG: RecB-like helicase [Helicobacteraceae bacterium]|jgi:exodeoxyribonuclease V beta subunit|nr:RecB-like helicase [Helicobacteraceae bacterium]
MSGFRPYLACEASAGSGKTYQLSLRYAALLLSPAPPERILCLTFTNKAANEMRSRITKLLENLASGAKDDRLEAIANQLGYIPRRDQIAEIYESFLRSETKIMTLDAFFNRILRQFSLYIGLSPLFEVGAIDLDDAIAAFLAFLRARGAIDDFAQFLLETDQNAQNGFGVFQKLYTQTRKLEAAPIDLSAIAAAKTAAFEAFKRLKDLALRSGEISQSGAKALEAENLAEVLERGGSWLAKSSLSEYRYFKKVCTPQMDEAFFAFKAELKRYFDLKEQNALARLAALCDYFAQSLAALKKRKRLLDFDDVTHFTRELLSSGVDKDFFYFRLDARIEHLLIDEFQDTSPIQFEILRPIIEEFAAGSGTARLKSFFYVGDQKQSIYRFRGGAPYLFDFVASRYANIERQTLENNYRSGFAIVDFTNRVFAPLFANFTPQKPLRKETGLVRTISAEDPIEATLQIVEELLSSGATGESIAVLVWKNDDGKMIAESLRDRFSDLSVITETTQKLNRRREARAIVEALKYLYFGKNPLYYANLAALLDEGDLKTALQNVDLNDTPLGVCAAIADRLRLSDLNTLKFLEWTATLNWLEEIFCDFEALDLNAPPIAQSGLRALTVHKAKGLEFAHTIVVDRLSAPSRGREKLIFDEIGAEALPVRWRQKRRECADEAYAETLTRQQEAADRNRLNELYVALTRARDSLFIVKNPENSIFDPLNLSDESAGALRPPQPIAPPLIAPKTPPPTPRKLGAQSGFIKKQEESYGDSKSRDFGLALHYALETMGDFDAPDITAAIEGARNRYGLNAPIDEVRKRVDSLLTCAAFCELIKRGKRYKEASLTLNGEVMRIDLLIDASDGWIVIDYKSGKPNESHGDQVRKYLDALKATTGRNGAGYVAYIGAQTRLEAIAPKADQSADQGEAK